MADSALARMPLPARIAVTLGLLVLGGIAYYVAFYSEVAQATQAEQAKRGQLRTELQQAKDAQKEYQKDVEERARRRERERELNKILPQSTEYPAFLSSIQSVATNSGVDLTAWTPQPEVKEEYYARVPMQVELTGRFHQVAKFFYGIGQNDRIMNVENINIESPDVRDQEVYVQVSGLATAFRALGEEEAGGEAAQDRRSRKAGQ